MSVDPVKILELGKEQNICRASKVLSVLQSLILLHFCVFSVFQLTNLDTLVPHLAMCAAFVVRHSGYQQSLSDTRECTQGKNRSSAPNVEWHLLRKLD